MPKICRRKKTTLEKNNKKPTLFLTLKKPKPSDPLDSREGFCYKDDIDDIDDDDHVRPEKSDSLEEIIQRRKKLPTKRDGEEVNKRKQTNGYVPKPMNDGGNKRKHTEDSLKEQIKRRCRKHNDSRSWV